MVAHRKQRSFRRKHPIVVLTENPARAGGRRPEIGGRRSVRPLSSGLRPPASRRERGAWERGAWERCFDALTLPRSTLHAPPRPSTTSTQQVPQRRCLTGVNNLRWPKPVQLRQQGAFARHLRSHEFARGQIRKRQTKGSAGGTNCRQKIIPLRRQYSFIEMGARTKDLCDLPLDQLAWSGVFHLVANGHLSTGPEQTANIGFGGVKWDAAHRHRPAFGQGHIEQLRTSLRVLKKQFIKIAQPEKQQRIFGQFALDAAVLRHHRAQLGVAGHCRNVKWESSRGRNEIYCRSKASAMAARVPIRTLSTASLISPCPGFENGTLWKASLPPPLLTGQSKWQFNSCLTSSLAIQRKSPASYFPSQAPGSSRPRILRSRQN